jgi:DNA-binding winged helix-turn-helix (wHTH) protein
VIVRLVAREEPYASYAEESSAERDSNESLSLFISAQDEVGSFRDVTVLPAADAPLRSDALRSSSIHIAYGPVAFMDGAFAAGCADYMLDPWCLVELRSRVRRFSINRFAIGEARFTLRGQNLAIAGGGVAELSEHERRILRLLTGNIGSFVPRSALSQALWGDDREGSRCLDMHIGHIRKKLTTLSPEAGKTICSVRGLGYRILCRTCG